MSEKNSLSDNMIALIFFLIPSIMLILGFFVYPISFPPSEISLILAKIPMFIGLILLAFGFICKQKNLGHIIRMSGWVVFAFFWSTMPYFLYASEGNDIFNAVVCFIGVYVLVYLAYHEWLSLKLNEEISCLKWIAGASGFAGIIYWGIEFTFLGPALLRIVAEHSAATLNLIMGNTHMILSLIHI